MNLERIEMLHAVLLGAARGGVATGWLQWAACCSRRGDGANFRLLKEIVRRVVRPAAAGRSPCCCSPSSSPLPRLLSLVFWRVPVDG